MATLHRLLDRLWLFILCGILMGGYFYQIIEHEAPCPLCMLQRLAMIGIVMGILLNLRFGYKEEHYGLSLLAAIFGLSISLRQIALHVCPQFPTFGQPILHYDLYFWAFIVFLCSMLATSLLLMMHIFSNDKPVPSMWSRWDKLAFAFVFLLTFANVITTFSECGFSACQR